jgi:hypothetical protein
MVALKALIDAKAFKRAAADAADAGLAGLGFDAGAVNL